MPYDDPEPDDPTMLVGVRAPADDDSMREMAYAFAEEFTTIGFDRHRLLALFRSPHYAGAHGALRALGEAEIERIVDEIQSVYGGVRFVTRDAPCARKEK